jgi:hypothetical protein
MEPSVSAPTCSCGSVCSPGFRLRKLADALERVAELDARTCTGGHRDLPLYCMMTSIKDWSARHPHHLRFQRGFPA